MSGIDIAVPIMKCHCVPLIEGPPGVGKSAAVADLARRLSVRSFILFPSHKLGSEVHGQPVISKTPFKYKECEYTVVEQAPPRYVLEAMSAADEKGCLGAIINIEEFTTITAHEQAPFLGVVADFMIGEIRLNRYEIGIVICCNPPEMAAGGTPLTAPAANRMIHLKYEFDPVEFATNFVGYWGNPPELGIWGEHLPEGEWIQDRGRVAAFLRSCPDQAFRYPDDPKNRSGAWPSPRQWDSVSRFLTVARLDKLPHRVLHEMLFGAVGQGAASQFLAWSDKAHLPDPRDLVDDPQLFNIPNGRSDLLFYILTSCIAEAAHRHRQALDDHSKNRGKLMSRAITAWLNCWRMLGTVVKKDGPKDVAAVAAKLLSKSEARPKDAPVPDEVVELAPVVDAAGLDWTARKKGKGS